MTLVELTGRWTRQRDLVVVAARPDDDDDGDTALKYPSVTDPAGTIGPRTRIADGSDGLVPGRWIRLRGDLHVLARSRRRPAKPPTDTVIADPLPGPCPISRSPTCGLAVRAASSSR
jgi:hypothetical protein